jgi:hypothetical protein
MSPDLTGMESLMRKSLSSCLVSLFAIASLVGCVSDREKEVRRSCAFDVAGDYSEVRSEGVAVGGLIITNEADKNDVKVVFNRGALYDGESAMVELLANEADRATVSTSLELGAGPDALVTEFAGGQNVSTDIGESSEVTVRSASYAATAQDGATDAKLVWELKLTIDNGTDQLTGTLRASFSQEQDNATGNGSTTDVEGESFPVTFARTAGALVAPQGDACAAVDAEPAAGEGEGEGQ